MDNVHQRPTAARAPASYEVVGVGDADVDIYLDVPQLPGRDEKVAATAAAWYPGGMVANFLVALRRLGTPCCFHGPIGAKRFPDRFEQANPFTWVEHYRHPEEGDPTLREIWSRVRFDSYTPRLVTLGGVVRTKLGPPRWIYLPPTDVARLIGLAEMTEAAEGRR
jgi:hypothetical protein